MLGYSYKQMMQCPELLQNNLECGRGGVGDPAKEEGSQKGCDWFPATRGFLHCSPYSRHLNRPLSEDGW